MFLIIKMKKILKKQKPQLLLLLKPQKNVMGLASKKTYPRIFK
jgi:hypothetical protein